jgi:hypothetical protein
MGAGLFALSACATEEIGPGADPPPAEGTLLIAFAPADATFEERQARLAREPIGTGYQVLMDGAQLGFAAPLTLTQGSQSYISPIPAGLHHFEIVETDSGTALFAGDGEIKANAMNRFYLFGDLDDLQARFTSYALVPAPDTLHVDVINLVRGGTRIEVTTCSDPGDCSPLSAPLAFGEVFAGDFAGGSDATRFWLASGATLGFRQVPTAALPDPPIQPMRFSVPVPVPTSSVVPANVVAVPLYMSSEGNVLWSLD